MRLGEEEQQKSTTIQYGPEARESLKKGLILAADAVACTMGPRGKCVLIQRDGQGPLVTKDGVTVSKSINLKNPQARMGAELIREAASRTNEVAGDGTTTATVLTRAMVVEGLKLCTAGYNTTEMRKGIQFAIDAVVAGLKRVAKNIETNEEVAQIGTISANGDKEIGTLIADAMGKVGRDGIITVEDAKGMATSMEVVEGMQFERGYLSPYFVTSAEKMNATYSDACVLVTDKKLTSLKDLIPMLEECKRNNKPILIIADDVEGEALQGLILNRAHAQFPVVAVKAPGYGALKDQLLNDIATLTGATFVSTASGMKLESVRLGHLGQCKKIVVDAKTTTLVAGNKTLEAVQQRVSDLKGQMEDVTLTNEEREILRARVAKLASGVAVIKVGGTTEIEMVERKFRIEDALNATKAAVEEGIVPGGGAALFSVAKYAFEDRLIQNPSFEMGVKLVRKACQEPLRQIARNADTSEDVICATMDTKTLPQGWDASSDRWVNLMAEGIIDPVKVTRHALENAASVAMTFLSLDAVIVVEET